MDKIYTIESRTGCTCCRYDNFWRGFYATENEAETRANRFRTGVEHIISSRYSKYGHHKVVEHSYEEISNNRFILDGTEVFDKAPFVRVNLEDGSIISGTEHEESLGEY